MNFTPTAEKIFKMKYAVNENETWEQACLRVSEYVANAEKLYGKSDEEVLKILGEFYNAIYNMYFLPGGRILANAGTGIKNLYNCFFLPIEDSRQGIYGTLKDAAEIFAWGGGCGYNFSSLREEGALIKTTGGKASGPLSFLSLFDQTGEVIQQASRRGAQIALLDVSHPDIEKFIDFKSIPNSRNARLLEEYHRNLLSNGGNLKGTKYYNILKQTLLDDQLTHFNISVVLSDDFMLHVVENKDWNLLSVVDGHVTKTVKARDLLKRIAEKAWKSGEPGFFFIDRVNEDNLVPYIGKIRGSNPCGEIPLHDSGACDLGSINLYKFYDISSKSFDWSGLEEIVRLGVRFLDNVHDVSTTPLEKINKMTHGLRQIGLGVFGLADLLAEMELPYGSQEARDFCEYLSWFITFFALLESNALAEEKGTFEYYNAEIIDLRPLDKILNHPRFSNHGFDTRTFKLRNVSVTGLAPTGSIALLSGSNGSIEPFFALAYKRYITQGVGNTTTDSIIEINPILFRKLKESGLSDEDIEEIKIKVLKSGNLSDCEKIPVKLRSAFQTSHDLTAREHLLMQAVWQQSVTNAVSKTINCPESTTPEEIYNIIIEMWNADLKGGTIYRDKSRSFQILNSGS